MRKIHHTGISTITSKSLENQSLPTGTTKKRSKASLSSVAETTVPLKKAKKNVAIAHNFLVVGAKKAKAARHARNAARVGSLSLERSRQETLAHTGSGKKLSEVVRLKYIKGFTEAVRIPCRMDDL
jgi:chromosome transmission fidelity protein 18